MTTRDRLRIAVQKEGRLTRPSLDLLGRCGLTFRQSRDALFCIGETLAVDLLLVRDDDIPGLLADGVCDLGVIGRNVLREDALARRASTPFHELRALGFGDCHLSIAIPETQDWHGPQQLTGQRIATTYPHLLGDWLDANGVRAQIITLSGSVEIAPRLGTADAVCDLVSSGATLAANALREVAVMQDSEAVLASAAQPVACNGRGDLIELLLRRLDGVLDVNESRLLMLEASRKTMPSIVDLLPDCQRSTLTPVENDPERLALQAVCRGNVSWNDLEDMKRAGAQAMLVLPVEKMLS